MTKCMAALSLFAVTAATQACATVRPPAGSSPRIEVTGGLNMVQLPSAQFPGATFAGVLNFPRTPEWGIGIAGDVETSYLVETAMAGARVYRRTSPLYGGQRAVTGFAQLLVGEATGGVQGVMTSEGGLAVTPSVGLEYGSGVRAFHLQAGYRNVRNSAVHDSRIPDGPIDDLSGVRVVLGMTWRLRAR
jgi:hypothetical protein